MPVFLTDFTPHSRLTNFNHLLYPIVAAPLLILFRYFLELNLYKPIGVRLGLKPNRRRRARNGGSSNKLSRESCRQLEAAFKAKNGYKQLPQAEVDKLTKSGELSERQVGPHRL